MFKVQGGEYLRRVQGVERRVQRQKAVGGRCAACGLRHAAYVPHSSLLTSLRSTLLPLPLMQKRYISHFLEWLTVSILAFNIPYINTLLTQLPFVITIPWNIYVAAFKDQHAKPVKDL